MIAKPVREDSRENGGGAGQVEAGRTALDVLADACNVEVQADLRYDHCYHHHYYYHHHHHYEYHYYYHYYD